MMQSDAFLWNVGNVWKMGQSSSIIHFVVIELEKWARWKVSASKCCKKKRLVWKKHVFCWIVYLVFCFKCLLAFATCVGSSLISRGLSRGQHQLRSFWLSSPRTCAFQQCQRNMTGTSRLPGAQESNVFWEAEGLSRWSIHPPHMTSYADSKTTWACTCTTYPTMCE